MKVKAKIRGVYGGCRHKPGAEFELFDSKDFNAGWMEEVKRSPGRPKKTEETAPAKKAKAASNKV